MGEPPVPELLLQLPEVRPGLVAVQPGVHQGLVHGVTLAALDLGEKMVVILYSKP